MYEIGSCQSWSTLTSGEIDAMVVQNPYDMGYRGTRLMKALVTGDQKTIHEMLPGYDPQTKAFANPDDDLLVTGLRVVHANEGSPLKAEMFAPTTEFLSLDAFKKWLAEHDLKGS